MYSPEARVAIGISGLGRKNPHNDEWNKRISESKLGVSLSPSHCKAISEGHKGLPREFSIGHCLAIGRSSRESWERLTLRERQGRLGATLFGEAAQRGRDGMDREAWALKISSSKRGIPNSRAHCEATSRAMKAQWANPSYAKMMVEARGQGVTIPEISLGLILERNFPKTWKYTGSGPSLVTVGGKIPDFMGIGENKIIEVFGNYWHDPVYFPNRLSEEELTAHYKKFGFSCIVLWGADAYSESRVLETLSRFS